MVIDEPLHEHVWMVSFCCATCWCYCLFTKKMLKNAKILAIFHPFLKLFSNIWEKNKCQTNVKTLYRAYLSSNCLFLEYFVFDIHDTQTVSKGSPGLRIREKTVKAASCKCFFLKYHILLRKHTIWKTRNIQQIFYVSAYNFLPDPLALLTGLTL